MINEARKPLIAVIGLAGRFPDAPDAAAFWRNLADGVESIQEFSEEELIRSGIEPRYVRDSHFVKKGTFLENAEWFDAAFFGFTPREAEIIDPQHRVFLECSWDAMENAGYGAGALSVPVGVFAGATMNSYLISVLFQNRALLEVAGLYQLMIGNDKDFLATRVSYKLDLRGPSVTVQTACSSSLVAVQLACQSLQCGQCDMALAGGVSLRFPQKTGHLYVEGMIFSRDGHCRPFDAASTGIRGGAGAGVVVLKRLEDALRDGDAIRAVIRGAAVNNDGAAKMGYTAPGVGGQAAVVSQALREGDVEPSSVSYIEAHGTATPVGDPIEIAALEKAFGPGQLHSCAIGSVKSNIGHLDAAAGVAGFIKTVLALEHKQIPPSLHYQNPNPQIDFAGSRFYVNDRLAAWEHGPLPRRAGVSSFGIGGSNAHVVLEEAPAPEPARVLWPAQLLVLSARTATALDAATARLAAHLRDHPDLLLADVAYTAQIGRKRFAHRRTLLCSGRDEALELLSSGGHKVLTTLEAATSRPVTFLFTGQGSQHIGMGCGLYSSQPVFRREFDRCADLLWPELGCDLREIVYSPDGDSSRIDETWLSQPALFAVEYALARLWMSWGVYPESALGHSIGEYVAACLAGVFSLEDALRLVAARGRLMQRMPAGKMLAVPLAERDIRALIDGRLSLAAVNTPSLCTVSGADDDIGWLRQMLQARGVESRTLHTSHAFHSSLMEAAIAPFLDCLRTISFHEPAFPFVSNITGRPILPGEAMDPEYWAAHLRQTVRFEDGIRALASPGRIFVEIGPGRTLTGFAQETARGVVHCEAVSSLPHPADSEPDTVFILRTLAKLWAAGVEVNWEKVHEGERLHRVPLPSYPFERQRYWAGDDSAAQTFLPQPDMRARKKDIEDWFYVPSWTRSVPPSALSSGESHAPWLILADRGRAASIAADRLAARGETFTVVEAADAQSPADCARLLKTLASSPGLWPRSVLCFWPLDGGKEAFSRLLSLAQAFGESGRTDPVDLVVVTSGLHAVSAGDSIDPEQALVIGPYKVIPHEYPYIRCRIVDIPQTELSPTLMDELLEEPAMPRPSRPVAWRGGRRWEQTFEAVRLPAKRTPRRESGVYVITGGMGGIGLTLAQHLAGMPGARLALIGRSSLPERPAWPEWLANHGEADETSRKIRAIERMEQSGSEVLVLTADVCDRVAISRALAIVHERFGPIHGVVHAAGIGGGGIIQLKSSEAATRVLAPKVDGTVLLASLVENDPLDFFMTCSSINALCGVPGAVDYTAANAFQDALAESPAGRRVSMVSINWDTWQEVGMAVKANVPTAHGIRPEEGIEAFERVLAARLPRVAVVTGDLPRMMDAPILDAPPQPGPSLADPHREVAVSYAAPETATQIRIAEIWRDMFGIGRIGLDDNFFELGGHSLLATGVLSRIGNLFALSLPLRSIFEAPTVRSLAEHVDTLLWAAAGTQAIEGSEDREEIEI